MILSLFSLDFAEFPCAVVQNYLPPSPSDTSSSPTNPVLSASSIYHPRRCPRGWSSRISCFRIDGCHKSLAKAHCRSPLHSEFCNPRVFGSSRQAPKRPWSRIDGGTAKALLVTIFFSSSCSSCSFVSETVRVCGVCVCVCVGFSPGIGLKQPKR